ncbi:MAG TPA: glycosyltransferase family 4 protein [Chloroflexia bacterium]|jgi:glycosyltransferase involved in cell wall biosynthesis
MWIWHAAVVGEYQKPLAVLGECPNLDVSLLVPYRWPERPGQMVHAERPSSGNYRLIRARTIFTGFYYVYFFPGLFYHLLRAKPDVIYCYEEAHTLLSALILAFRHLFMPDAHLLLYAAQNIKKRYPLPFRLFERYSFRRADAILACGTRVAQTLRSKSYQGELRVVPLPTDAQAFSPDASRREVCRREMGLPPDAVAIGYAGKLVEEKGLRTLWKAFARLARECPNVHLVLAGGGPLKSELQASAASAGLEGRLHMAGVVHNSGLPGYMNALDVFVLPSETRPNWREQFGRVIVEAMSSGVPVVGSDSGEIPSVLGDAGLVFPEGDSDALAARLRNLVADHSLRARLSHAGRERVLNLFSTEKVAAQHYAIYEEMVARH